MLGPRIAALRRSAKLSQAELAQLLKISPSTVGMYEQGRREPSLEGLVNLAAVLEVSADYLLTGKPLVEADRKAISKAAAATGPIRSGRFSREELTVLFASLLTEP